ncbi:MAG: hypothetical protein M1831_006571 [Alyxoria varia]|nr:MAG: hypothetical protein M1831_006571 [Alyxoria varia]
MPSANKDDLFGADETNGEPADAPSNGSVAANPSAAAAEDDEPNAYITLVSSDEFEFVVKRSAAVGSSELLRRMFAGQWQEQVTGRVKLNEINGVILEKVCEYFYYNEKHRGERDVQDIPDLPPELCLELLMAADYLKT